MSEKVALYRTLSVCPKCLKSVPALIYGEGDAVYMHKACPEHGEFNSVIWEDTAENYVRWLEYGGLDVKKLPQSEAEAEMLLKGGGFDACAHCLPSSAALMTTNRCNMDCPVCFTRTKGEALREPDLAECELLLRAYRARAGEDAIVELCGGEPTARPDILELAALARDIGFDMIQLNTNGIKLAASVDFCRALKENGVTTAYLGFDAVSEKPYYAKYGKPMFEIKKRAVENAAEAGLAVILVCCVIPGENDGDLGGIVEYAKAHMPAVKGVYFQPVSYFGIYPEAHTPRITIPGVIRKLAEQCADISMDDFGPGTYEHPQCSFHGVYIKDRKGTLRAMTHFGPKGANQGDLHRMRAFLRTAWRPSDQNTLTVGGMAFQDSSNIDLIRLRRCSIQIIGRGGTLVPLCGKYLSGCGGERLLPGID